MQVNTKTKIIRTFTKTKSKRLIELHLSKINNYLKLSQISI